MKKVRWIPDDEYMSEHCHMERMSRGHIYLAMDGQTFDLKVRNGRIQIMPQTKIEENEGQFG